VTAKQESPSAARNRQPVLEVLQRVLPPRGLVLEIASGSGEHAVWFARALPGITWQPSDVDDAALISIEAWRVEAGLANLRAPIVLDVTAAWPAHVGAVDAIVCLNMIHIAPWAASEALFAGAARALVAGAPLVTYGPYRFSGAFTAASNEDFDRSLRARDPRWGIRDVDDLDRLAATAGFRREETLALPANNHALVWRRGR
jgi:SAM-dependent methyltransferase